jgi:hypothetical protein
MKQIDNRSYEKCTIELTDKPSKYTIRATSFNIALKQKKKDKYIAYNRTKDERKFWREEREEI